MKLKREKKASRTVKQGLVRNRGRNFFARTESMSPFFCCRDWCLHLEKKLMRIEDTIYIVVM